MIYNKIIKCFFFSLLFANIQPDSPEYKAACKLWDLYLRTRNEFVQKGEADDEDDDEDGQDNQGTVTEGVSAQLEWAVGSGQGPCDFSLGYYGLSI